MYPCLAATGKSSGKQASIQRAAKAAGTGQRVVFEDIHGVGSMHGAYAGKEFRGVENGGGRMVIIPIIVHLAPPENNAHIPFIIHRTTNVPTPTPRTTFTPGAYH